MTFGTILIYGVAFLAIFILGAIAQSHFSVFKNKETDNLKISELAIELQKSEFRCNEMSQDVAKTSTLLNEAHHTIDELKSAAEATQEANLKYYNETQEKLSKQEKQMQRIEADQVLIDNLVETEVIGYEFENKLITITNTAPKNIKTVRAEGKAVKLYYTS